MFCGGGCAIKIEPSIYEAWSDVFDPRLETGRENKMTTYETKSAPTWTATIFIAGQISEIEDEIRYFVLRGLCVTLEPCKYIFKGGSEDGAKIGLINYPRFPPRKV